MTAIEMKDRLMKCDKDSVCGCLASIVYQLREKGIKFKGYEEEKINTLKVSADGELEIVPGVLDPLEHRAKLDFSGLVSVEVLIHYFQVEINNCKRRLESEESTCFNGVDCGNFEVARELNKAYIRFCEGIINQLKSGYFK